MKTLFLHIEPEGDREPDDPRWLDEQTELEHDEPPEPEKVLTVSKFEDIAALCSHLTDLMGKRLRYEVVDDTNGRPGATGTFVLHGEPPHLTEISHERRPTRTAARKAIREFLSEAWPEMNEQRIKMVEDGDHGCARNKCGWAWWIFEDDSTSYVKEDLTVEWLGHSPPEEE